MNMGYLDSSQQQLILDFYFRCGDEEDIARGRDLIASNAEAAKLYANLEETLTELDSIKYEPCPDNLADLTVARLKLAAVPKTAANGKLHALLKQEQKNSEFLPAPAVSYKGAGRFWRPVFELLATAAAILLVAGILFPSFGAMRERSRQIACAGNLGQIGRAMAAFGNEHNGLISDIKVKAGSPWWKIGYEGPDIQSNTCYPWQLVRDGYVDGRVFICGGHIQGEPLRYNAAQMASLKDFPSRRHISFSFMIICDDNNSLTKSSRRIIASDMNPLFQKIPFQTSLYQKLNEFDRIHLDEKTRTLMSFNHRAKGQNSLFCDGSVEFMKTRIINNDDIFTVKDVDVYTGKEIPCDPEDVFLAP